MPSRNMTESTGPTFRDGLTEEALESSIAEVRQEVEQLRNQINRFGLRVDDPNFEPGRRTRSSEQPLRRFIRRRQLPNKDLARTARVGP
jgi:hypothetical protein